MILVGWIVIGLLVGYGANAYLSRDRTGLIQYASTAVAGALAAGLLVLRAVGPGPLEAWAFLAAFVGACLLVAGLEALLRWREKYA